MRRAVMLAAVAVTFATTAVAAPLITPPTGWTVGPNADLAAQAAAQPHFGTSGASITAERYDAPTPGIVLMVVRASAATTDAAAAAGAEMAALRDHGPTVQVTENNEHLDDAEKTVEVTIVWRDTSTKASDTTRALLAASKDHITGVTGECLAANDVAPALVDACKQALRTLHVDMPAASRVAFAPATHAGASAPITVPPAPGMSAAPPAGSAARPSLPPISVPQDDPPADKRPLIIGAGLLVLAAVFWWNRKRRARFAAGADQQPESKGPRSSGGKDER